MSDLLECGHAESPHSDITRGYGTAEDGKRHCYDCCTAMDLASMKETGKIVAYISDDGKTITNWPGRTLAYVTRLWETRHNIGGKITHVWARAADGTWWHGKGPGKGMYIRLHRSKSKRHA